MSEQLKDFARMEDFDVKGKTVLFRADLNSAVINRKVQMKERIEENAKTIRELSEKKAKVVILAHQGRAGQADFLPLEQHAQLLRNFVEDLKYVEDIIGPVALDAIRDLDAGEVLLLDNVRMLAEETLDKTPEEHSKSIFVRRLAPLADIYINDAFSVAHRSHASVVGFPKVLDAGIGRLMERELIALGRAVHSIKRPVVYVLGGAKPEEVFDIMDFALERGVDTILTTGAIGNLFLYAKGVIPMKVDKHLFESVDRARRIAERGGNRTKYPWDVAIEVNGKREEISLEEVKPNQQIYDIGKKTSEKYAEIIRNARTVIMKGPAGAFEKEGFSKGTKEIFKAIADSDAFSVLGGGHTSAAISEVGMDKNEMDNVHVSLAGGAFLRYLLGKPLPGIEVLRVKNSKS